MTVRIQYRRGTAAQWASQNPVLAAGEPGFETDTRAYRIGDGTTPWTSLPRFLLADAQGSLPADVVEALGEAFVSADAGVATRVVDVAAYPSVSAAVAALNSAGGGELHFPRGTWFADAPLVITVACKITGSGMGGTTLSGQNLPAGTDLLTIGNAGGAALTGVSISGLTLVDSKRDNLAIVNVRDLTIAGDVASSWAGRDGIHVSTSWVGTVAAMGYRNGRDTVHVEENAHAIDLNRAHSVLAGRHGFIVGSLSVLKGVTCEHNGGAGVLIAGRESVTVVGGYFEDDTDHGQGGGPAHHVHVVDSSDVILTGVPALQYVPDASTAVVIEGSRRVVLDMPSTTHPVSSDQGWEYEWGVAAGGARALYVSPDSSVEVRRLPPVPMYLAGSVIDRDRRQGVSVLTEAAWTAHGTPTLSTITRDGETVQRYVTTGGWQGIRRPVTLKANTLYTVGAIITTTGTSYFSDQSTSAVLGDRFLEPIREPHLSLTTFMTGATPPTHLAVMTQAAGQTVTVANLRVVEGAYTLASFPLVDTAPPARGAAEGIYVQQTPPANPKPGDLHIW